MAHLTAANVGKNAETHSLDLKHEARYLAGDFGSACSMLRSDAAFKPFDIILTAETVYNEASARQIVQGCQECLTNDGRVYVASKSHYFGVGGGLAKFKRLLDQDGRFSWSMVRRWDDGNSNIREVLKLVRAPGLGIGQE